MGLILILVVGNFLLGFIIGTLRLSKFTKFENDYMFLIIVLGAVYWIAKLILVPYRKNKKKQEKIKDYQDKLIRKIDGAYDCTFKYKSISNVQSKIKELKSSLNQDLYSRALDSYNDMLHILIKCSDGEGNIDINEFESIIKEAIEECIEIVNVAYKEHEDRLNKAKQQYYNNKKEEIKQDLENMKNKNKEFKTMWRD